MTSSRASDRLAGEVLVGDGGMGSLPASRLPRLRFPEEANVEAREVVLAAHVEFIRAGADVIQTNTYGANAVKLGSHRFEDRVEELNEAGAKIAREAREIAGRDVLIAGSVGPLGTSVEVIGGETPRGAALYAEQAAVLEGRGADLIVLETFTSLEELTAAVAAVRAQCHLPIVAQITVQEDGETVTGARGDEVAAALAGLGVAAVGINCSLGPQSALAGLREMQRSAATPLTVQPNIGLPMYRGRPRALPRRVRRVCRRVRRPGAGARRPPDRRLLRQPAAPHRGHPQGGRRAPAGPLRLPRTRDRPAAAGTRPRGVEPPRATPRRRGVGDLGRARPAQGLEPAAAVRAGGGDQRHPQRRVLRHQRQPDGARPDELADDRRPRPGPGRASRPSPT